MNNPAPAKSNSHRAIRAFLTLCCVVLFASTSVLQVAADASIDAEGAAFEMSTLAALNYSLAAPVVVEGKRVGSSSSTTTFFIAALQGPVASLPFRRRITIERPAQLDPTPP